MDLHPDFAQMSVSDRMVALKCAGHFCAAAIVRLAVRTGRGVLPKCVVAGQVHWPGGRPDPATCESM